MKKNQTSRCFPHAEFMSQQAHLWQHFGFKISKKPAAKKTPLWGNFLPLYKLGPREQLSQSNLELAQSLATSKCTNYHRLHQNWRNRKPV